MLAVAAVATSGCGGDAKDNPEGAGSRADPAAELSEAHRFAEKINAECREMYLKPAAAQAASAAEPYRDNIIEVGRQLFAECLETLAPEYDGPGDISLEGGVATAVPDGEALDADGLQEDGSLPPDSSP